MDSLLVKKRAYVDWLLLRCPMGDELPSCVLERVRKLSPEQRMSFISSLSEKGLDSIIEYHESCSSQHPGSNNGN